MLYGIPRSSRWLVTKNRTDEALAILKMMGSPDSEAELREIVDSIHLERGMAAEPLFKRSYRLPIFLAVTIGLFNQLAGINAILYYSNYIFASAGFSQLSSSKQTVLIGRQPSRTWGWRFGHWGSGRAGQSGWKRHALQSDWPGMFIGRLG
jgi:hypothetical protein